MNLFGRPTRLVLVTLSLVATASGAWAQSSATGTANATATVIRPITLASAGDLVFGNVVASVAGGTLLLTAASPAVPTATGITQPGTQTTVAAAVFNVGGEGAFTYSILPIAGVSISDGALHTMTVDTFTTSAVSGVLGTLSGTAGGSGTQSFYVGGTLHVGSNQVAGNYTGTFSVTVAYN
jgi:spore coat protein U-like protein